MKQENGSLVLSLYMEKIVGVGKVSLTVCFRTSTFAVYQMSVDIINHNKV